MKLNAHPRYAMFEGWFKAHVAQARPIDGKYFRVAGPRHTTAKEIVQGVGAYKAGGRWNPPEVMNVVYLSVASVTALLEADQHRQYYSLPPWHGMPKVVVAVEVVAETVLDLTDPALAADLPEPMVNLLAEDWRAVMARGDEATAQAMGRAAFGARLEGLIVPSKPDPNGANLLIFPVRLVAGSKLGVLNPAELERLGKPA